MHLMLDPFFDRKKILVIEKSAKAENDRTWCFWETGTGLFEELVYHRWRQLELLTPDQALLLDIGPYQYKMIRGIDLYRYVRETAAGKPNIEWREANVQEINNGAVKAIVTLDDGIVYADHVFNSILFKPIQPVRGKYLLQQHFLGWQVKTGKPCFDPLTATFMDFRTEQDEGTCFFYVLPVSATEALVEYTLFSERLLKMEIYEEQLRNYLSDVLHAGEYSITHTERGSIPMTNIYPPLPQGRIVPIGIAGGHIKPSSGYAFMPIQKRTKAIINALKRGDKDLSGRLPGDSRFRLYDSVLLNVLYNKKVPGRDIFASIFAKNPPQRVLRFLDNESSLAEDLQIMASVPSRHFLPAAFHEMLS